MPLVIIFHIARRCDWEAAVVAGAYEVSTRDTNLSEVGFIHASYAGQVAAVAEFVYAGDETELCVLMVDVDAVRASGVRVVDEDGGNGEMYPHIYGHIDPRFVTDVRPAGFDDGGRFWFSG